VAHLPAMTLGGGAQVAAAHWNYGLKNRQKTASSSTQKLNN